MELTRRKFIESSFVAVPNFGAGLFLSSSARAEKAIVKKQEVSNKQTIVRWMSNWMDNQKALGGAMRVSRFKDPMYFLLSPISWAPNPKQATTYSSVEAPTGFVTDFASIPHVFWSLLKPDGDYAYAAVLHDYLYWTQTRPRSEANDILKFAMLDLSIDSVTLTTIDAAVRAFGKIAWDENAKLKLAGEKRILKKFPDDPTVSWADWKKRPDVFE